MFKNQKYLLLLATFCFAAFSAQGDNGSAEPKMIPDSQVATYQSDESQLPKIQSYEYAFANGAVAIANVVTDPLASSDLRDSLLFRPTSTSLQNEGVEEPAVGQSDQIYFLSVPTTDETFATFSRKKFGRNRSVIYSQGGKKIALFEIHSGNEAATAGFPFFLAVTDQGLHAYSPPPAKEYWDQFENAKMAFFKDDRLPSRLQGFEELSYGGQTYAVAFVTTAERRGYGGTQPQTKHAIAFRYHDLASLNLPDYEPKNPQRAELVHRTFTEHSDLLDNGDPHHVRELFKGMRPDPRSIGAGTVDPKSIQTVQSRFRDWGLSIASKPEGIPILTDEEIYRVSELFYEGKSAVLTGESGNGKSTLLKAFILAVKQGRVHGFSPDMEFRLVDRATLGNDTSLVGQSDGVAKAVMDYARTRDVIFVCDNLPSLIGAGAGMDDQGADFFSKIMTALSEREIRIFGTATSVEYENLFERDFKGKVNTYSLEERPLEHLAADLKNYSKLKNKELISDALYDLIAQRALRFGSVGSPLKRAIDLHDRIYGRFYARQKDISTLDAAAVDEVVTDVYGLDPSIFDKKLAVARLKKLEQQLQENVLGLNYAIKIVLDRAAIALSNVGRSASPNMNIFLDGPPGLAKTHLAVSFAQGMGLKDHLIDMSEFMLPHTLPAFLARIADIFTRDSVPVVIFDEIDKACIEVQNALLGMSLKGYFTVNRSQNSGRGVPSFEKVFVRNGYFFYTGNAASDFAIKKAKNAIGFTGQSAGALDLEDPKFVMEFRQAIEKEGRISAPLLSRMAAVIPILPPGSKENFNLVATFLLKRVLSEIQSTHPNFTLSADEKAQLLTQLEAVYYKENATDFRHPKHHLENLLQSRAAWSDLQSSCEEASKAS